MGQNTEDKLETSQRNCCFCGTTTRKIYILIFLIALLNIAIWGSLVAAHLHQRNELRELRKSSTIAIAECRRHVASINPKLHQDRTNNMSIQRNIIRKSSRNIELFKDPKNVARRQAKLKVPTSCPFQKRRRLCALIAREVSRHIQLNLTELRKEVNELRLKINNVQQDRYREAYVILIGKNHQSRFTKMNEKGTASSVRDMYNIRWDRSSLLKCHTRSSQLDATTLEQCRITRSSGVNFHYFDKRTISAVKVKVPGIYLLYCRLTFTINNTSNSNNIAHFISKVSILMTKGTSEHIELISQIPVVTRQGNEPLITVSVFTQAYLYSRSKIRVTISLRNGSKLPLDGNMALTLYKRKNGMFNVFGIHLLKKTDDRGPP